MDVAAGVHGSVLNCASFGAMPVDAEPIHTPASLATCRKF
jgi:hypothetical protein